MRFSQKEGEKSWLLTGHDPASGSGQEVVDLLQVGSDRIGSGQVGTENFQSSLTGQVGPPVPDSTRPDPTRLLGVDPTRQEPWCKNLLERIAARQKKDERCLHDRKRMLTQNCCMRGTAVPYRGGLRMVPVVRYMYVAPAESLGADGIDERGTAVRSVRLIVHVLLAGAYIAGL